MRFKHKSYDFDYDPIGDTIKDISGANEFEYNSFNAQFENIMDEDMSLWTDIFKIDGTFKMLDYDKDNLKSQISLYWDNINEDGTGVDFDVTCDENNLDILIKKVNEWDKLDSWDKINSDFEFYIGDICEPIIIVE